MEDNFESGKYHDVDLGDRVIRDEDIAAIEKEMKKVAKTGKKIISRAIAKQEAIELFKDTAIQYR